MSPEMEMRSWTVIAQSWVFQSLIAFGLGGEIVPALAARVERAGVHDVRVWLRPESHFSDGSPLTLLDVGRSLDHQHLRSVVEGQSLLISSEEPDVPTEYLLFFARIFKLSGGTAFGTGPFVVSEQDENHILLSRREPAAGHIRYVSLDAYPTPREAFARTLKGDADLLPDVDPRWIEFFEGVPRLRMIRAPGTHANAVLFNINRLTRLERKALSFAIADDQVRKLAFGSECVPPEHRPKFEPLPPGRVLDVMAVPIFRRFALAVRRSLGERGGDVRIEDLQQFFAEVNGRDFDLAAVRPLVWPQIIGMFNWHTGAPTNILGYSNPAVDAALDSRDWAAAQRALEEDPPVAVVCTPPSVIVLDARIKATPQGSLGFLQSLPDWEITQ